MFIKETNLKGCYIIKPTIFDDERGTFFESFNQREFQKETGLIVNFVQENQSTSKRGVLRGLHFQKGAFSQAKLVRIVKGKVLDVVVDLRKDSLTYGSHCSFILSEENKTQLFVPRGFAHGFVVLENDTICSYKCDNYYNKEAESGIRYDDPTLGVDWMLEENEVILSEKDRELGGVKELGK